MDVVVVGDNNNDDDACLVSLDAAVARIRDALRGSSPPVLSIREDGVATATPAISAADLLIDKSRLKQKLVGVRGLIVKASEKFGMPYKDIVTKAYAMLKEEQKAKAAAAITLSVAPAAVPSTQPEIPDIFSPTVVCQNKSIKNLKTIMKLKHLSKALKYAIWDYQDGQSIEEAAEKFKITPAHVRYSIDLIRERTGETMEQFRNNKSLELDAPQSSLRGGDSGDYQQGLVRAVTALRHSKEASILDQARANRVSFFDLVDKIVRELEIENKICNLQPVDVVATTAAASPDGTVRAHQAPPHPHPAAAAHPPPAPPSTCDSDDILSDIEEVIRNDTLLASAALHSGAPSPASGVSAAGAASAAAVATAAENVQAVFVANICEVCKRVFLDQKEFRDHVEAGCLDF